MSVPENVDDVVIGVEMGLMSQADVVNQFRDLVAEDPAAAADRYDEFATRLDSVASGDNAQVRSLIGGPDSACRAALVDIMTGSYQTASDDVKTKIRDEAIRPLLRDNYFYVRMAVARMTNPFLIGDIIREDPATNPGADYYEEHLVKSGDAQDPDLLQLWLNDVGPNFFAATTIALQRNHTASAEAVLAGNEDLFRGAAHITAARHDLVAEVRALQGVTTPKAELIEKYRGSFVDGFIDLTRQAAEVANWLPIGEMVRILYQK